MSLDFEIMPFRYLPAWIRWAYADFCNKEYGDVLFETVDDVDFDDVGVFWYGAIFSDESWTVDENYEEVLYQVIESRGD
jgi:hypothetical protein